MFIKGKACGVGGWVWGFNFKCRVSTARLNQKPEIEKQIEIENQKSEANRGREPKLWKQIEIENQWKQVDEKSAAIENQKQIKIDSR
ncbi:hypothetical protein L1887_38253 [Cichorium endivia]|nr:hypothetical protein L1887_38253 [Cichorium endivia]